MVTVTIRTINMKTVQLTVLLCINVITSSLCQGTAGKFIEREGDWYIAANASVSRYCGDISERWNFAHLQLSWSAAANIRYRIDDRWSVLGEAGMYRLTGDQRYTKNKDNYLTFQTVNPFVNAGVQWDCRSVEKENNVFYLFGVVGGTYLNPTATLQGTAYELSPLHTEDVDYARFVGQAGYGVGVPFVLSPTMQLRIEGRYTHVFSDYLDDVSDRYVTKYTATTVERVLADRRLEHGLIANPNHAQRGNPAWNDGYFLFTVQLSLKLKTRRSFYGFLHRRN